MTDVTSPAVFPTPQAVVDNIAPLLVITFLNAVLYGMLCLQSYMYFRNAENLYKRTKVLLVTVALLWVLNTFHLFCAIAECYWFMVTHFGNTELVLTVAPWSGSALFLTSLTCNLIVQGWFTWRIYILSNRNKLLGIVLAICVFGTWAAGTAISIVGLVSQSLEAITNKGWIIYLTNSLDVFTNFIITTILCFHFMKFRRSPIRHTRALINALIVYTVNTGALGLLISTLSMILRAVQPNNIVFFSTYIPYSQLYTNALLASLNARDWLWQRANNRAMMSVPLSDLSTFTPATRQSASHVTRRTQHESSGSMDLEADSSEGGVDKAGY